jgi:DNA polymerase
MTPHAGSADRWVPDGRSIQRMRTAAHQCRGCALWADATQVVFSAGSRSASFMLVGEQPGDAEDRAGEPFVGPAGRILEEALVAARIDRRDVYLTNAVKHFRHESRGKRRIHQRPLISQIDACRPWLTAEIDAVRPDVIVCLGAVAARAVLGRDVRIGEERGRLQSLDGSQATVVIVTGHPSAVLRLRGRDARAAQDEFSALVRDLRAAAEAQPHAAGTTRR